MGWWVVAAFFFGPITFLAVPLYAFFDDNWLPLAINYGGFIVSIALFVIGSAIEGKSEKPNIVALKKALSNIPAIATFVVLILAGGIGIYVGKHFFRSTPQSVHSAVIYPDEVIYPPSGEAQQNPIISPKTPPPVKSVEAENPKAEPTKSTASAWRHATLQEITTARHKYIGVPAVAIEIDGIKESANYGQCTICTNKASAELPLCDNQPPYYEC